MRIVLAIYGTRPEAIKVAPVIADLKRSEHLRPVVAVTGQHRQMLDQVNGLFGVAPDYDLDIIRPRQTLEDITSRTLAGLIPVIKQVKPDCIFVQGDTTTCFSAALSAFYHRVPVVHLEAGLRTQQRYNPYPEEMNRRLTTRLATLHLAPTSTSRANLLAEGVDPTSVLVTGNTVIDALHVMVSRDDDTPISGVPPLLERRLVLITAHRRESWGEPMARSARAIARLASRFPDVLFILPVHLNPVVRETLLPLLTASNIVVTEPLDYADFVRLIAASSIVLTDSGGIQEEAPSLGKPVLVMRETTERPEAVAAGTVRLVGTDEDLIVNEVSSLLTNPIAYQKMARAVNPYGDGHAARRCVEAIEYLFALRDRPQEFSH